MRFFDDLNYSLWQIISVSKKTFFGYRVTVLLMGKDSVKVGDTVYLDIDKENEHSQKDDFPAVVYKIAWSNWVSDFYQRVNEIAPDKTIYCPDRNDPSAPVWVRLWLRTKCKVKAHDIIYASPDIPK